MKRRILSMVLAVVMIIGTLPAFALTSNAALVPAPITSSQTSPATDDGVHLSKEVSYDPATGKVTTTIEAYTTGTVTLTNQTKPTDIVLVLDTSGSMANSFGNTTGLKAMQDAVGSFIDATAAQNAAVVDPDDRHSIAIVRFSSEYRNNSSDLTPGNNTGTTEVRAGFTTVYDQASADSLSALVDSLEAEGATSVDYGLTLAANLFSARATEDGGKYADREKVVIVFTDGDPTHGSGYSEQVAYNAVSEANILKSAGATIYTVGIFAGADPDDIDGSSEISNKFMNYVSSNYPKAYGTSETDWVIIFPVTTYSIEAGAEPHYTDYYKAASDTAEINNIFVTISEQIGQATVELGEQATLIDVISDYFTIQYSGTKPDITLYTSDYLTGDTWDTLVMQDDTSPIKATLIGTDTIELTGFDFDENYVTETGRNGFFGKKLVLTFVTEPNYEAIDAAGTFTDAKINSNDTAALLDSQGNAVDWIPSPMLQANTVTYQVVDAGTRTIATYYRLPGATVTPIAVPADTAEYTYSAWTSAQVDASGATFTMPQENVILTSTGTSKIYHVSYTLKGNVPSGIVAPTGGDFAVGADVTHPTFPTLPEGYVFSGWTEDGNDIAPGVNTFTMPAEDLHFEGYFTALDTSYTVEHWLMDENGNYVDDPKYKHTNVYDGVLPGDVVSATVPHHTGFTYDLSTTTANNATMQMDVPSGSVLADGKLVLKVYYQRNQFKITYHYDGTVPPLANPAEGDLGTLTQTDLYYGSTVTIADPATATGYIFSGWRVHTGDTTISDDGKTLVMPNSDIILYGSFTADSTTPYHIEHYFEGLDGNYTLDRTTDKQGEAGTTAYAEPLSGTAIAGFTYDEAKTAADGLVSGTIVSTTPSLTLKLFYSRTRHTVTYEYTGTVPPTGADPTEAELTAAPYTKEFMWGETVKIEEPATASGYTFVGWNVTGTDINVTETAGVKSFIMPTRDVVITGHFNRTPSGYQVKHFLEAADGSYGAPELTFTTEYATGIYVGDVVTGKPNEYNTYTYAPSVTEQHNGSMTTVGGVSVPAGTVDANGDLVLSLYYTRNAYEISYRFADPIPSGMTAPNGAVEHGKVKHGHSVDLVNVTAPAGYSFDGWYHNEAKVGDSLVMPRANVELVGYFKADKATYTVNYYLQNLDGTGYELDDTITDDTKVTGTYVEAPTRTYTGFSFDTTQGMWNGHVAGDNSLVLDLYYNRNSYTVTYYYYGTPHAGVEVLWNGAPATLTAPSYVISTSTLPGTWTVPYGTALKVEPALTESSGKYEFRGWNTSNLPGTDFNSEVAPGTSFTMPAHNVEFRGALFEYVVYYNLNGGTLNGADTVDPKSVNFNDASLLPVGTPAKSGAVFTGWTYELSTTPVTNTTKYSDLAVVPFVTSVTLTANFKNVYTVSYDWGTSNVPAGVTLPIDAKQYAKGESYTVDTTYPAGYKVEFHNVYGDVTGIYTFSGWTDPSAGTIGESDVLITGSWSYKFLPAPEKLGNAKLTKVDAADKTTPLSGVVFALYTADGTLVSNYTTDKDGVIKVNDLDVGSYYWLETRPAEGYVLDDATKHTFEVRYKQTTSLVVENHKAAVPEVFGHDHYGYVIGRDDGLVHPEALITKAEVATIFFRLLSEDTRAEYMTRENSFTDVNEGDWYNTAISTLAAMGIISGRPDHTFGPDEFTTRAEFAAIAARFDEHGNSTSASFVDIYDHWAKREINIAAHNGWVLGYEDGTFKPDQQITRAEAMAMVNRVLQRIPQSVDDLLDDMIIWPDNMDTSKWYYLTVQEATNSHYHEIKSNGYERWTELRAVPDWATLEKK